MAASESTAVVEAPSQFAAPTGQRGLWRQAFDRLCRNRVSLLAAIALSGVLVMTVLANTVDWIQRYPPHEQQYVDILASPSWEHFFGTDNLGRDNWARVWEGLRISLQIAIGTQVVVVVIGVSVGACAALGGRWSDNILMRFTDLVYAFPDLLAIILMRAILSDRDWPIIGTGDPQIPGLLIQMIIAIAIVSWVTLARLIRGQMLELRESDYVLAARAVGASGHRVLFSHMLPNTMGTVIVAVTFGIPTAIFAEAVLGYIGFGLPPPAASLGTLISEGQQFVRVNAWMIVIPSAAIALLMLCFTFLGDGLRDALDPRTRR